MKRYTIRKIIDTFCQGKFSEKGKRVFGIWLSSDTNAKEKEEILKEIWNKCETTEQITTNADWQELQSRIVSSIPTNKTFTLNTWRKYAAVITLLIVTSATAWYIGNRGNAQHIILKEYFAQYGANKELTLPDGTKVLMKPGSLIVYPEDFSACPSRQLYLCGEAYFAVAKNPDKAFIVSTSKVNVQALGTHFTVEAYANEKETRATLEEGSIKVEIKNKPTNSPYILTPCEQLVYNHKIDSVSIKIIDLQKFKLQQKGFLIFENAPFNKIITEIENKFGVRIQYSSNLFEGERYNLKFTPNESLEKTLKILTTLLHIDYDINGNDVFLIPKKQIVGNK